MKQPKEDWAHWRQVGLLALGFLSVVASIGHFEDWRTSHAAKDLKIAVGFAILFPILFTLTTKRWELLFQVSFTIVIFGMLGTILNRSLAALPVMAICVVVSFLVVKYKFNKFK